MVLNDDRIWFVENTLRSCAIKSENIKISIYLLNKPSCDILAIGPVGISEHSQRVALAVVTPYAQLFYIDKING